MHETSSPISQQTNNTSHIASVKVRLSWKSESDSPFLLAWPLLSSTSSSWSTLKIGFLLLLLLPMLLFTLRLFCCCFCCCYCCCYLPFFSPFLPFSSVSGIIRFVLSAMCSETWFRLAKLTYQLGLNYDTTFLFFLFLFLFFFLQLFFLSFDGSLYSPVQAATFDGSVPCSVPWFFWIAHFVLFVCSGGVSSDGQQANHVCLSVCLSVRCLVCVCVQWRSLFAWFDYILRQGKGISPLSTTAPIIETASDGEREIRPWRFRPDGVIWNSAAGWASIGYASYSKVNLEHPTSSSSSSSFAILQSSTVNLIEGRENVM